jgi:RimJ/RimL family protein N-acetyltransferase
MPLGGGAFGDHERDAVPPDAPLEREHRDITMTVRRLRPADAEPWMDLRRRALADAPLAFGASPEDDRGGKREEVDRILADASASAVFGAFDPSLVGTVGVVRLTGKKSRHKAIVWGMFVVASHRRRGHARALVEAAIAHARGWPGVSELQLSVSETTPGARRLYESLGFVAWGREPRALQHEGVFADEIHLQLTLSAPRVSRGPSHD